MILTDTVYQRVLALANKEQRGYITPQEFNLMADQAQLEILEQYFYDINQFNRMPSNDSEYSDMVSLVDEKLSIFKVEEDGLTTTNGVLTVPDDVYKIGTIFRNNREIEEVSRSEYFHLRNSPLTRPTGSRAVWINSEDGPLIEPPWLNNISMTYVRTPVRPRWGYVVVGEKALYDPTPSKTVNFELHEADETELVYKILKLAGVAIQRQDLTAAGGSLENSQVGQEKQ